MKLAVVVIPVSDVARAKAFCTRLGWRLDADFSTGEDNVVQFTPPGSQCSVHCGTKLTAAAPGSTPASRLSLRERSGERISARCGRTW
jgi:catechol 2,3-dioxygenase-like lactoylglutathione lyase family enzyme